MILVGKAAVQTGAIRQAELEKLRPDGFVVRSKDGQVALAGARDSGTLYATIALLEKAGYRYYAPTFQVVPKATSPVLPNFEKIFGIATR